jgi:3-carboxy-cis,cis-muconate cycloisomerase
MNGLYSQYLSDIEIDNLVEDRAFINYMIYVEIVLSKVQSKQGIIPKSAANEIAQKLKDFSPLHDTLTSGTLHNGIPTIALLREIRKELSTEAQGYIHWGATSQDIMDTATILMIRDVIQVLEKRLSIIIKTLRTLAQKHEQTYMVARTRTQQAIPFSFGLKVNNWVQPLDRHLERLSQLKPRLLVVQLGGAAGNLAGLGNNGYETAQLLAEELDLNYSGIWHSQRDNISEFSNWMALVAGSFGKMAQDILLLSQTEIGEVMENGSEGGKSSTMPHKNNPVLSEAILALSKYTAQLAGLNMQAMIIGHERDASAWISEWLTLPQMMSATGTILTHVMTISRNITVNKEAMQANLEKLNGLIYSEQATFILCKYMSMKEAKNNVGTACQLVLDEGIHLADALDKLLPSLEVKWRDLLQAKNYQGSINFLLG